MEASCGGAGWGGVGWGYVLAVCSSEIVLRVKAGGGGGEGGGVFFFFFGELYGKSCIIRLPLSFFQRKNNKEGKKANEERRPSDLLNI